MVNYLWDNIFKKDSVTQSTISLLNRCYVFSSLTQKELKLLEKLVSVRNYQTGEYIFRQGEVGVGMYLVSEGCIDIYIDDIPINDQIESTIEPVFVTRLKKGDFFGEHALVEEQGRRTATAIASADTRLIGFFKPDLTEICDRSPVTGVKILLKLGEILGRRLKETTVKISELKKQLERLRKV